MPRRTRITLPRPELNIVPMMDLVLNLITFFVLVANFAVAELPGMAIPAPVHSQARNDARPNRLTINIMPDKDDPSKVGRIVIGTTALAAGDYASLENLLKTELAISPHVQIHLRADRSIHYDQIEPLMILIANTGVSGIQMVAEVGG